MYVLESLKKAFEQVTGVGKPSAASMHRFIRRRKAHTSMFRDDGTIPNNPTLPFIHYRRPVRLTHAPDPAAVLEELFESNGWGDSWRNGIYDFLHYHSGTHEVLGIARGHARVRFGGRNGKIVALRAGDVVILPAGTGHQRVSASPDLLVVGAYTAAGQYDECKGSPEEHAHALQSIPKVRLPTRDPVYGAHGPLFDSWMGDEANRRPGFTDHSVGP
jgi:uncharacterized protein YjlB